MAMIFWSHFLAHLVYRKQYRSDVTVIQIVNSLTQSDIAYRIAALTMTLSDLDGHLPIARLQMR